MAWIARLLSLFKPSHSRIMPGQFDRRCSPEPAIRSLNEVRLIIDNDVCQGLSKRGKAARSSSDDQIFANFNTSLAVGLGYGLASFYLDLARDLDERALQFESANATEIHKGSLYFNAAVCALVNHNFDAALHYFVAAGEEDHKTHGHSKSAILLTNGLFQRWVTNPLHDMIDAELGKTPTTTSGLLPTSYPRAAIDALLGSLPIAVVGAVIISLCRYLTSRSFRTANEGTSIVRYSVVADLCVVYEITLKTWARNRTGTSQDSLGKILRRDLAATSFGDVSSYASSGALWPCQSLTQYDQLLGSGILAAIDSEPDPLKKTAKLIHFVTNTRNQVVHDLQPNAAIYQNDSLRQEVARRVLVAICLTALL